MLYGGEHPVYAIETRRRTGNEVLCYTQGEKRYSAIQSCVADLPQLQLKDLQKMEVHSRCDWGLLPMRRVVEDGE